MILLALLACAPGRDKSPAYGRPEVGAPPLVNPPPAGWLGPADRDADGYAAPEDCDDGDASRNPGTEETCNGVDDDCDGVIDGSAAIDANPWYPDRDGDGYGDATGEMRSCDQPHGAVADSRDCDDSDADVHPDADEWCDGVDTNCSGDESDAADAWRGYVDADRDGWGGSALSACSAPEGSTDLGGDCDDTDASVNPAATEECDGVDNDCANGADDASAVDAPVWYADQDGDGFGVPADGLSACVAPTGYVADATDCDDSSADTYPGGMERCDEARQDEDCDGESNEADAVDAPVWFVDADGDSFGDPARSTATCDSPDGYVGRAADCDDSDDTVHPNAVEDCTEAVDRNCDGAVGLFNHDGDGLPACRDCDDRDATVGGAIVWFDDSDGDTFGEAEGGTYSCWGQPGDVLDSTDCDDARADVHPGAPEVWYDGIDQGCDGGDDDDQDADGYGAIATGGADCDDEDASTWPGAPETCNDGVDQDCGAEDALCRLDGDLSIATYTTRYLGTEDGMRLGSAVQVVWAADGSEPTVAASTNTTSWADLGRGGVVLIPKYHSEDVPDTSAAARWIGESAGAGAGRSLAATGDMTGDGVPDLAVGAPREHTGGAYSGAVYLVPPDLTGDYSLEDAPVEIAGELAGDEAGSSLAALGDVDGNGAPDLLVGAPYSSVYATAAGAAYLVGGPATADRDLDDATAVIYGTAENERFGVSLAGPGDVDGDGLGDVLVGSPAFGGPSGANSGRGCVFFGPVVGTLTSSDGDACLVNDTSGSGVGIQVDAAGDVNGDGLPDLLIAGVPVDLGSGGGAIYIFHSPLPATATEADAAAVVYGTEEDLLLGLGDATGVGDLDQDGYADVALGEYGGPQVLSHVGVGYGPLAGAISFDALDSRLESESDLHDWNNDLFGTVVVPGGDINADGYPDFLASAAAYGPGGTGVGAVYVVAGGGD